MTGHETICSTYDHRSEKAAGPVRSPVHKLRTGRLVFEWVTIGESLLLYVFGFFYTQDCYNFASIDDQEVNF